VQGVRYQIIEEYGCGSGVYQSGVAIIFIDVWPLLFPLISISLYCCAFFFLPSLLLAL
jgi:hypothetical protein